MMRVARVVLHNVKSYAGEAGAGITIALAPGINAICGENGSGKSTILEAIGYTLFGFRPYRQEAFLREGEKNGSITVTVEDDDGCSFHVVRRLGSSSTQYVVDELDQRIAEGEADVRKWLLDLFHLEPGTDLAKLFEDAVGPPQGTLTSIFLEAAGPRAKKFDRLLGIEDYPVAAQGLRAVSNLFRDQAEAADRRAAVLEGDARRLPEVERQLLESVQRRAAIASEVEGLRQRQEALAAQRTEMERARHAVQVATSEVALAESRRREAQRRQEESAAELRRAEEAARVAEASREGSAAYQQALEVLRQLEGRRREKDALRQKADLAGRNALGWDQQAQSLREQLASLEKDAARAAELEQLVAEQERREAALRQAEQELRAVEEASRQLATARERARAAEERLKEARERLEEVERARPPAARLGELREQERRLGEELVRLEQRALAAAQGRETLAGTTRRLEELSAQCESLSAEAASLRPLEALAALAATRQSARDEAAAMLSLVEGRLAEALKTRTQVEGGLCPFFHEPCKNLRSGISLDGHFDGVIKEVEPLVAAGQARLAAAEAGLAEARAAQLACSRLPDLTRQLEQVEAARAMLEQELARLRAQREDWESAPVEQARAAEALGGLRPELAAAEAAWAAVSAEAGWRRQAEETSADLERERKLEAELGETASRSIGVAEAVEACRNALAELGDPRGQAVLLRQRVARERPVLARSLERTERDATAARAAEAKALGDLEPYAGLDDEIAAAGARRDQNERLHQDFLASRAEAERLPQRREAHEAAKREAEEASSAFEAASRGLEEVRAAYDEGEHERVRPALEEVLSGLASARRELELREQEEARLGQELAALREREGEMRAIRAEAAESRQLRDAVEAIRWALDAAGPEIARALVRRVSARATALYRDLLGQPAVSLEWGVDYEIRCRVRAEEREFKLLSGGEQMAAALAVRLALLQTLSNLRIAFLDEPTAHMDAARRANLAAQIQNLRSFDQLIVISHDDSFDTLFGHVVRLAKRNGTTIVEP